MRLPTSRCGTPCSRAGCCARATRPAWNRRCGRCWPCTRRCGSPSPTPSTTVPGTDPDRASYQIAVQTAQDLLVTGARNVADRHADLAGGIGRAVLASLHGPRRPRVCARKVKSPLSRWNKHQPGKPRTCQQVTSLTTVISQYQDEKRTRRRRSLTPASRTLTPRHCG